MNHLWLLIDVPYLAHVAKYSTGGLSFGGNATGTVFGVLHMIARLQEQFYTDKLVFCFDSRKSFRKEMYPAYKGQRHSHLLSTEEVQFEVGFRNQVARLRKTYLPMMGYKNIGWKSGYESDDLLAAYAEYIIRQSETDEAKIITADHDLFQCINRRVSVFNPKTKEDMTLGAFHTKYGIAPKQWVLVKAIAGCESDNVKGIHGVGEKTAIKFLRHELKEGSKAWEAITCKRGQKIIDRNMPLVMLPMQKLNIGKLHQDKPSIKGFRKVVHRLGFASMETDFNPFPMTGRRSK